jgi:hypothetical protein
MIAAADFQNAWPTPLAHTLTIHMGPNHLSQLQLPAAKPNTDLPEPEFLPSEFPPLPPDQIPTPQYAVRRDLIGQTVSVNYTTRSGVGINRSNYTVSINKPAEATVKSEFDYPFERAGMSIQVKSQCVTRSDETSFHHLTEVEITLNGRPHWTKSWTESVPRGLC